MRDIDLMSPERVASEYGGDKRKIGEAVQMGLIDPTVGVMAGLFIDRIRAAAAVEQAPRSTVAEDVMTSGLGAAAPMQQGLAALPVPESIAPDEYAGGGIVAFEKGGDIDAEVAAAIARRDMPLTEGQQKLQDYYKSAETRAAETKSRAFNEFLTEMGFRAAASKSPRFLQAFGEAGAAATPRLTAGAKEAREIQEAGMKGLAEFEGKTRAEKLAAISAGEKIFSDREERLSRKEIAALPKDLERAANTIFDEQKAAGTPISREEAFKRATAATTREPDRFTALRNAWTAASNKVAEAEGAGGALDALRKRSQDTRVSEAERAKALQEYKDKKAQIYADFGLGPQELGYLRSEVAARSGGASQPPSAPAAAPSASPLPAKQSDLRQGTVYNTARGPATWDGKQFIPVR